MTFTIQQESRPKGAYEYRYLILKDGCVIAHYWHDHRGDGHGIEFLDGTKDSWLVGQMTDFLEGGGPQPIALTAAAIAYLSRKNPR